MIAQNKTGNPTSSWKKYRKKHCWQRIEDFPEGISAPEKVRLYRQSGHFRLQWWDPGAKRNCTDRVDGDLIAAISRAREIDEQILNFRTGGIGGRRLKFTSLVDHYQTDLERRADSGDIKPATVSRYMSALSHFEKFSSQPHLSSRYPSALRADREFALEFQTWLQQQSISPNGHDNSTKRPFRSVDYVLDVVRGMLEWAADPHRGNLIPAGFRNPFRGRRVKTQKSAPDLFGDPDITLEMAEAFLTECDDIQLPLFALLIFCGLRAAEPCYLMHEHLSDEGWLKVISLPGLGYTTKGRRDKRFPLPEGLQHLLKRASSASPGGLILLRRQVLKDSNAAPLFGHSLAQLESEYDRRCRQLKQPDAQQREAVRDQILKEAGGLSYDQIEHAFHRIAQRLNWPRSATLKDFRHLFGTEIMNIGMPDYYRKYLMGQAFPNAAFTNYTHLNELSQWYERAMEQRYAPLLNVIEARASV